MKVVLRRGSNYPTRNGYILRQIFSWVLSTDCTSTSQTSNIRNVMNKKGSMGRYVSHPGVGKKRISFVILGKKLVLWKKHAKWESGWRKFPLLFPIHMEGFGVLFVNCPISDSKTLLDGTGGWKKKRATVRDNLFCRNVIQKSQCFKKLD